MTSQNAPHPGAEDRMLRAALTYSRFGWPVFPCGARSKIPLTEHGFKVATTDETQIRAWWSQWPAANVAVATGTASKIVVLDVDVKAGGREALAVMEDEHGRLPEAPTVLTGGGGLHIYFRDHGNLRNSVSRLGPGLDIRATGGYVVVPPSIHPNGNRYEWEHTSRIDTIPPPPLPTWLIERLAPLEQATMRLPQIIPAGQRNDTLYRLGRSLKARALGEAAIMATLKVVNQESCVPPLSDAEVELIATGAAAAPDSPQFTAMRNGVLAGGPLASNTDPPAPLVQPFRLRLVRDYLAELEQRRQVTSYWADILRAGELVMVAGRAMSGKSTFLCALTRALVLGEPMLDRACMKCHAAYLGLERNGATVARLLNNWGVGHLVYFADEMQSGKVDELAAMLEVQITQHDLQVVFIDHLQNLIRVADTNDYAKVGAAMEPLYRVARRTGACIVVAHHQPKTEQPDGPINAMGSEGYRASVDVLIECRKTGSEYRVKGDVRGGPGLASTRIEINLATGAVKFDAVAETNSDNILLTIIDHLRRVGKPLAVSAIREAIKRNNNAVNDVLQTATERGLIIRTGDGKRGDPILYSLPGPSPVQGKESDAGVLVA